jgi:hypothetical protein
VSTMNKPSLETVGVRYTGWAALDRDPLDDNVEYTCPDCGARGTKAARRPRSEYHFTDGFVQDLRGENATCRSCKKTVHLAPVVLLHNHGEELRFNAMYRADQNVSTN